ncbi:MAG TPA: hypothetical protein VHK91_09535 [Flavisolibacter sp.]|jgi:hypothetical protein|nr:hypothetical protein [Flavisolibacter sp.]
MNLFELAIYVSILSKLLPIVGVLAGKDRSNTMMVLLILSSVSILSDVLNNIYLKSGHHGALINNIHFAISFALLSLLYVYMIPKLRMAAIILCLIYGLMAWIISAWWQSIDSSQSILKIYGALAVMVYCIAFFSYYAKELPAGKPLYTYQLYITIAYFLSYGLGIILFIWTSDFTGYRIISKPMPVSTLYALLEFIKNFILFVGIRRANKRARSAML